jgi:hypothetical protein
LDDSTRADREAISLRSRDSVMDAMVVAASVCATTRTR